jgi:hypothetical protein
MKNIFLAIPLLLSACAAVSHDAWVSEPLAAPTSAPQGAPAPPPKTVAPDMPTPAPTRDNHIALYLGQRSLDSTDYSPVEDQLTFGVEYVRERPDSVLGFELGFMASADDATVAGFDVKGKTYEAYAGLHKSFGSAVIKPYIGAGVAYINSEVEVSGFGSEDDSSFAGYAHGGLTFDLTDTFYLGVDARLLFGSSMTIAGVDTDADYVQYAVTAGGAF